MPPRCIPAGGIFLRSPIFFSLLVFLLVCMHSLYFSIARCPREWSVVGGNRQQKPASLK